MNDKINKPVKHTMHKTMMIRIMFECHQLHFVVNDQTRAPLPKTIVSLQLMVSLQTMVTTIATLLHSQSKSRNQWYLP